MLKSVRTNLLSNNYLDINFLQQQVQLLMQKRIDFADIYLQNITVETWLLDEGIIKSGNFAINQGFGIRAIVHDKSFLSYSNNINKKSIANLIENLFVETPVLQPTIINRAHQETLLHSLYTEDNSIMLFDSVIKTALLQKIDKEARGKAFVTNVIANLSLEHDEVCIVRSDNRVHDDVRPLIHLNITIIINRNNQIEKGSSGFGGRYLLNNITDSEISKHINLAYEQAIIKCDAVTCPQGKMAVVLGNAWAGIILHEAIGHGLEGDFNRKGSSAFSNKIGELVASKNVTVIDDGRIHNARGSLNIDDEGNTTQKNILIENGILCGYLFDELNAKLMNMPITGNGRRESFACNPIPRMTNTYMNNGDYDHEEIIASIENGIYADNFSGGQVDITSGQFVFNATIAWVIKNGKLAYPVKGCALVGNGPECLKYVSMVGNNLKLDDGVGTCGKDGQSVPVGVGQPTIRIDDGLIVGGG